MLTAPAADHPPEQSSGAEPEALYIVDFAAPAVVVLYLVLKYEPFQIVATLPGVASSFGFPALAAAILLVTPTARLARIPVVWSILAFTLWLAASRLWSESPASTDFLIRSELPALLLVAFVAGTIEPRRLVRVLGATFVAIVTWSLLASIAWGRSRELIYDSGFVGPQQGFRGTFGHKNELGIFAVFALAFVFAFVRTSYRRPLILVMIAAIVGTRSATAGSGLFIVLFLWVWMSTIGSQRSPRERSFVFLLSILSAITALLLALRLLPALLGLYQKDLTFSGRTLIWSESLRLIARQPFHGFGFGGLFSGPPPFLTGELRRRIGFDAAHAHNGTIGLLLDVGVVGIFLFVFVLAQAMVLTVRAFRHPATVNYGRWGLLSIVALVLMSLSEPLFDGPNLGLLTIVTVALARVDNDQKRANGHVRESGLSQSFAWRTHSGGT